MFKKKQTIDTQALKQKVAEAALSYIEYDMVIGIGTGSTVNCLIDLLPNMKSKIKTFVSSSEVSTQKLKALGLPVSELNNVNKVDIYLDGADEVTPYKAMLKGGGGALTREKVIGTMAEKFICMIDQTKKVDVLGQFPLPIEVIPMARSTVARELVKLSGIPDYREGFITDNGNVILDVHQLDLVDPIAMEQKLNQISGVICNGIFALRPADQVIVGTATDIEIY